MRDSIALRRWTAAAQWLLIAAAAYSGALLINGVLAFWLDADADEPRIERKAAGTRASQRGAATADYAIVLERNLFGSEPIRVAGTPDAAGGTKTALDLRLRGTAQVDDLGYAVIEDIAGSRQDVFVVGERVFDGPQLVAVHPGVAILLGQGRKQTLEISEVVAADEPELQSARAGRGANGRAGANGLDGIKQTGDNTFLVDRREVEHSIENLNQIATQMRAVPYMKDGATIGFRVFNIRRNSVFDRMGLRNGDVIQRVNGVDLDSPTKALALLEDVQTSQEIRVDLVRGDAPSTLTYTVR